MIRADSWATVGAYAVAFGGAVASRLHAYWPRERQRRAQQDADALAQVRAWLADEETNAEDAAEVERWMDLNGFAQQTTTHGIDEATEVQLTAATDAFRARLSEILATDDFQFHLTIGLDNTEDDA